MARIEKAKLINQENFNDLAQDGIRILFILDEHRILEGAKGEIESYFIIDVDASKFYQIDLATCFELVTCFYIGVERKYVKDLIEAVIGGWDLEELIN